MALIDRATYKGTAGEGLSYARFGALWQWSLSATQGLPNHLVKINELPIVSLDAPKEVAVGEPALFDASDTTDDGEDLVYQWNFGEGEMRGADTIHHIFSKAGTHTITLTVTDADGESATGKAKVTVKKSTAFVGGTAPELEPTGIVKQLQISEILPNLIDSDTKEFIELFNPTNQVIDLSGFFLDDIDGGSKPYTIPDGTEVQAGAYIMFPRSETNLALNNTGDSVRLLLPDETLLNEVAYEGAKEGLAYATASNGKWSWTATPTPGAANAVKAIVAAAKTASKTGSKTIASASGRVSIADARQAQVGSQVEVSGTIAVLPGIFGSQYFYPCLIRRQPTRRHPNIYDSKAFQRSRLAMRFGARCGERAYGENG